MKILVACEFSGKVSTFFRSKGHSVVSCDILPGWKPRHHYQGDVKDIIHFPWDMLIAFPPCTYICCGSLNWLNRDVKRRSEMERSLDFVKFLMDQDHIPRICIENPIGKISSRIRKPDQIVYPWMFGQKYSKDICLWLKGLPLLKPTKIVQPPYKKLDFSSKFRKIGPGWERKSIFFTGVSRAMAEQWG